MNESNEYKITKEQSDRINILKMLFTVFVVYIHSNMKDLYGGSAVLDVPKWLDVFKYFVSSTISGCANAGFFVIASILLYRKSFDWLQNLKKKRKTLLIPYIIMNSLQVGVFALCQVLPFTKQFFGNPENLVANFDIKRWFEVYGIGSKYPLNFPMWFIRNLLVFNILSMIIKKAIDRFPKVSLVILVINAVFNQFNLFYFLYPSYLLYWCLGYYIVKYNVDINKLDNNKIVYISFVVISLIDISLYVLGIELPKHVVNIFDIIKTTISIVFWYSCFSFFVGKQLQKSLLKYSKYSFPVYCFHGLILGFSQKLVLKVFPSIPIVLMISYIILPIIVIYCILIISEILKEYFNKAYSIMFGGR